MSDFLTLAAAAGKIAAGIAQAAAVVLAVALVVAVVYGAARYFLAGGHAAGVARVADYDERRAAAELADRRRRARARRNGRTVIEHDTTA